MAVTTYDLNKGNIKLSSNFLLSEFRTPGHNIIILDDDIVPTLNKIIEGLKSYFGIEVGITHINAGYRTPAYDRQVGGSGAGPHTTGKAVDFYFRGADSKPIKAIYGLCVAQLLNIKGIEKIMCSADASIHIDVNFRSAYWRTYQARNANGAFVYLSVPDFFTSSFAKTVNINSPVTTSPPAITGVNVTLIRKGYKGAVVKIWQQFLKDKGYDIGKYGVDGDFGGATDAATRKYQKDKGLTVDGWCGKLTWKSAGYICE